MSSRDTLFASLRAALGVTGAEQHRREVVAARLRGHPSGVIPARGDLPGKARTDLFARMLTAADGTVVRLADKGDVPREIAAYLRRHNLPLAVRRGADARLARLPWEREPWLEVSVGPSDGAQLAGVSHAYGCVAETGTLVMLSGRDNPTTLNFLPDHHIVVLDAKDVAGNTEAVLARLRADFGAGQLPRVVNMITGPSRSADIEQKLLLGAHGPRRLHVIVVGEG
jgi:L-lactate dehydrogenase complex protein LldG